MSCWPTFDAGCVNRKRWSEHAAPPAQPSGECRSDARVRDVDGDSLPAHRAGVGVFRCRAGAAAGDRAAVAAARWLKGSGVRADGVDVAESDARCRYLRRLTSRRNGEALPMRGGPLLGGLSAVVAGDHFL